MSWSRSLVRALKNIRYFGTGTNCYAKQIPRHAPVRSTRSGPFSFLNEGGYVMLVIPVTAFGLGTWQIKRREQKLEKIKYLEEKITADPVPLPYTIEEINDLEYRKVKVRGKFDYNKEMVIAPRHNIHDVLGTPGNMQSTSKIGGYVVVPFELADRNQTILVNRGHVTKNQFASETRQDGQIEGEVEIVGVVRKSEIRNPFMPKSATDPAKHGFWMYRDVELMAEVAETAPIFIDADYKSTVPGGPVGGQTKVQLRNEHMSYIITWYSLSLITFLMWKKKYYNKAIPDRAADFLRKNRS